MHAFGLVFLVAMMCQAQSAFEGYTFFASGKNCNLYDMDKKIVHTWTSEYNVAGNADMLRDSSVVFPSSDRGSWNSGGAITGGRLQIIRWDGTVTWNFLYRSAQYMPHHDIEPVYYTNDPNEKPNIMVICYTSQGDKITELKPTGSEHRRCSMGMGWQWSQLCEWHRHRQAGSS